MPVVQFIFKNFLYFKKKDKMFLRKEKSKQPSPGFDRKSDFDELDRLNALFLSGQIDLEEFNAGVDPLDIAPNYTELARQRLEYKRQQSVREFLNALASAPDLLRALFRKK